MSYSITCKGLIKEFNGYRAVDGLSFQVNEGEFFGLLGPNGAGKSTLMRMLSCQLTPDSGQATVMGYDVVKERNEVKKIMGVCPQENILYHDLTVSENLRFFSSLYSIPKDQTKRRIEKLLKFMDLTDKAKSLVETLSGGMKRRLNIAAALVHQPKLLMLDEPSIGLDPASRQELWKMITQIHREGTTIILTTHYMEEADTLCRRVAIMDLGKIVACDTPPRLKKMLGEVSVIQITSSKMDPKAVEAIKKLRDVKKMSIEEDGMRLVVDDVDASLPKIISRGIKEGLKLERIHVVEPTLEDVFLHLTGRSLKEEVE